MDFKSLMSAQIVKGKPKSAAVTTTKYQRRSDKEAEREAAYAAEQARLENERAERATKKRKLEEDEAAEHVVREEKKRKLAEESKIRREAEAAEQERLRRKRLGLPEVPSSQDGSDDSTALSESQPDVPDDELRTKLRALDQPAVLYEESHMARVKRYYRLVAIAARPKLSKGPIPTTLEPVPEKDMLLPPPTSIPAKDSTEYIYLHRQLSSYFTLLLTEWSIALASRPPEVKTSQSGKQAENTYLSVLRDLTPLYRKLEAQSLPADLLTPIVEIAHHAQNRRYVTANDVYLRLSIGKAAWPIGVTMVGIHERSAREKLHEGDGGDKKANIMADEVTRKMLQSVKRCLSFAQTRWIPDDVGQLMG